MQRTTHALAAACCALLLAACGGGGGESTSPNAGTGTPSTPAPSSNSGDGSWLTLSPSPVNVSAVQGMPLNFTVRGTSTRTFSVPPRILVLDRSGTLVPAVSVNAISPYIYDVNLQTLPTLTAGMHTANLEVRICEDDPLVCAKPFPGSPWQLPLAVDVRNAPSTNLPTNPPPTGQDGNPPSTPAPEVGIEAVIPQPNAISATYFEDIKPWFDVSLQGKFELGQPVYVNIADPSGLLTSVTDATVLPGTTTTQRLQLKAPLKPGIYTTTLEVHGCRDHTDMCKLPLAGGSLRIPVTINVKSSTEGMSLLTSRVDLSVFEDEAPSFDVSVAAVPDIVVPAIAYLNDPAKLISIPSEMYVNPGQTNTIKLKQAAPLKPGTYGTNVELRFCHDPGTCARSATAPALRIPVTITVKSTAAAAERVTLQPSSASLTTFDDDTTSFNLTLNTRAEIGGQLWVKITDPAGIYTNVADLQQVTAGDALTAMLQQSKPLKAGQYTPKLNIAICRDQSNPCTRPLAGSPWTLPVTLNVASNTNLTALQVQPQLGAWSTLQGNAAHTGYVPGTFDPAKFTRRWKATVTPRGAYQPSLAVANGRVFLTQYADSGWELAAISEDTGQFAWHAPMGALSGVNSPGLGNGKVFVTSTGHEDTYYWEFDQASGSLLSKSALASQWDHWGPPTAYGNAVYTESGYYGGMTKFDGSSTNVWSISLPQYDGWSPAVDDSYAYAYLSGQLQIVDTGTGKVLASVEDDSYNWAGYGGSTVVLSGTGTAYAGTAGGISAFDIAGRKRIWNVTGGTVTSMPAYAKGTVYVLNARGTVLEARDGATGALRWTSESLIGSRAFDTTFANLLVTDNLAFASTTSSTVAIDLATHRVVWRYPRGGPLAISDRGVLYVMGQNNVLGAVNLR